MARGGSHPFPQANNMGGDHNSCGCVPHHLPSRLEKAWQKHTWVGGQKGPHGGPGLYLNVPFALTQHTLHSTPHLQLPLPMKETNVPFGMENMGSYMLSLSLSLSIHPSTSLDRSLFERGLRLRVNYTIIAFFGGYVDLKRLSLSLQLKTVQYRSTTYGECSHLP